MSTFKLIEVGSCLKRCSSGGTHDAPKIEMSLRYIVAEDR